jgi:hypothetical protein
MDTLQFGVFLSPRAADIGPLREHVQVAEAAGFDYVSILPHVIDHLTFIDASRATLIPARP